VIQKNRSNDHHSLVGIHYETGKWVALEIADRKIKKIQRIDKPSGPHPEVIISPGLIDNQINGYSGIDFSHPAFTSEAMRLAARAIWKDGVTSFLPTLITNSHENLLRNFTILAATINDEELLDCIPGFHLEGPYLSDEKGFYGCHPVNHLRKPSWDEFSQYQKASGNKIIQVTISPELEGAINFIRTCCESGVAISIGHTNASAEQINTAVENGARLSTHLGNGCANFINRHKNPIWPQLANDQLTPSIIADGHHLLPEEIKVFYKVKGPENLILTSDVNHLIGLAPGKYFYMGSEVIYTEDGVVRNAALNCLAGASLPVRKGIETMLDYTGCTLANAIKMASENVAKVYGLMDRGTLEPGKRADIILFEKKGNHIMIRETWVNGVRVY
jgi:N-acetylglucosamine-6-phosphate deacetylase